MEILVTKIFYTCLITLLISVLGLKINNSGQRNMTPIDYVFTIMSMISMSGIFICTIIRIWI